VRSLGLDVLSVFGMPPVPLVNLAADLDCQSLSLTTFIGDYNPHGYPAFSLTGDAGLRRETKAAMADRGVRLHGVEGFFVFPGQDIRERQADLDAFAELETPRLVTISFDDDRSRSFDQFAYLAEMADERGMEVLVEFVPILPIADLATGKEAVRHIGRSNVSLMLDALHWFRSGLTVEDAKALDPALVGCIQLCDAPMVPVIDYGTEAAVERRAPGQGEFPLREWLDALPKDKPVTIEIPQASLADKGVSPYDRLAPCVAGARALLG
jgi:sugar phosphate isomerase/epimerase